MSQVPAHVGAPRTPQVNLLPPDVGQRRAAGRARRAMLAMVVLFTLLVGAAWYYVVTLAYDAQDNLTAEEARTPAKRQELDKYAYLPEMRSKVDIALQARYAIGAVDIVWADQLQALFSAFPSSMTLVSMDIQQGTPSAPQTSGGGVFDVPDYGSITFSATTTEKIDTAALIERINALPGYERTWIDTVELAPEAEGQPVRWALNGVIRITEYALSGRTETTQEIVPIEQEETPEPTESED